MKLSAASQFGSLLLVGIIASSVAYPFWKNEKSKEAFLSAPAPTLKGHNQTMGDCLDYLKSNNIGLSVDISYSIREDRISVRWSDPDAGEVITTYQGDKEWGVGMFQLVEFRSRVLGFDGWAKSKGKDAITALQFTCDSAYMIALTSSWPKK